MPRKTEEQKDVKTKKTHAIKDDAIKKNNNKKTTTTTSKKSTTKTEKESTTKTNKKANLEPKKAEIKESKSTKEDSSSKTSKNTNNLKIDTDSKTSKKETATKTTKVSAKTKKSITDKSQKDSSTTKKPNTKKPVSAKSTKKSSIKKSDTNTPKISVVEYYDLPYRYNQTVVKVLAQTPKTLFVYWDISDSDRENYKKQYGENFFETTKPVLIVHNDKLHYSFEVDINDFANSWYLHIDDSKSDYRIELGRRPISYNEKIDSDYIYITTSNEIESPNDHILFENNLKSIKFRNLKTNQETIKEVSTLSFANSIKNIYDIFDLYKKIYKNENAEDIYNLSNPSSHTSSSFK